MILVMTTIKRVALIALLAVTLESTITVNAHGHLEGGAHVLPHVHVRSARD